MRGPAYDTAGPSARGPAGEGPAYEPRAVTISGARLVYRDDNGEHVHPITKELTKIGRGGTEHWVDVMVSSGAQVSREHCRIRRDAAGRLLLQDVSTWGTFLNGVQVEKFVEGDPLAHEHELSHGASIRLADAVTLELLLR
jgi:pSer/pThr/pTyr-binding forkhead associated (FHA) protein